MKRFLINFRKSTKERAAEISAKAYNHYLRFRPIVDKIRLRMNPNNKFYPNKFTNKKK